MKEPRLPELANDPQAVLFRFTLLPAWGDPITVRARKEGATFRLFARRLSGQTGYGPGKLVEENEVTLQERDAATFNWLLTALDLF